MWVSTAKGFWVLFMGKVKFSHKIWYQRNSTGLLMKNQHQILGYGFSWPLTVLACLCQTTFIWALKASPPYLCGFAKVNSMPVSYSKPLSSHNYDKGLSINSFRTSHLSSKLPGPGCQLCQLASHFGPFCSSRVMPIQAAAASPHFSQSVLGPPKPRSHSLQGIWTPLPTAASEKNSNRLVLNVSFGAPGQALN